MKKQVLIAFAVGLCITANTFAQVPSYVPTNGLVGYWPFNGNANDESGNGNNGTVNGGALLSPDRNGQLNSAYTFNGSTNYISLSGTNAIDFSQGATFSAWMNTNDIRNASIVDKEYGCVSYGYRLNLRNNSQIWSEHGCYGAPQGGTNTAIAPSYTIGNWTLVIGTLDPVSGTNKLYVNGSLINSVNISQMITNSKTIEVGRAYSPVSYEFFNGKIDDIGIWNRTLSACEIADLYNSQINSVAGSILTSPQYAAVGSTVTLSSSSTPQSLQWQTNGVNLGWQNVPSNATYSGGNTNTLTVTNVQLSNHNQPFRVIASAGNCTDTSNVASIQIADTCITNVTVYDTLLTTVTDTLIINTTLSLPAPNNANTILIYPNPASDHITIDNGNYTAMTGYTIKIENNAGQQVFQSLINQAQFYVDLSTWTGNGLYFVHLIDPQNNTVTVRKIVLQ